MLLDNFSTGSSSNRNKNMIIVIIGSIIIGIIVFLLTNSLVSKDNNTSNNNDKKEDVYNSELSIKDNSIKKLYNNITYGDYDIFEKRQSIKLDNLSNYDKLYYTIPLIKKSDIKEVEMDNKNKIYSIDYSVISKYMKKMFGNKAKYDKDISMSVTFNFSMNDKNTANIKYNNSLSAYTITFTGNKDISKQSNYYGELENAIQVSDNEIELDEKILYYDIKVVKNKINYSIYKDYDHTMLIASEEGIEKDEFNLTNLLKEYDKKITRVIYKFKKTGGSYYFYSSKIETN